MMQKLLRSAFFLIMTILIYGCIKDTYDMDKLSGNMHLTPGMVISAAKGDVSFSDIVKPGDTVVFDQNKLVKLIFREDSVIGLHPEDFYASKSLPGLNDSYNASATLVASIDPYTVDLDLESVLDHITGSILISNPSIKLIYTNSFRAPVQLTVNASGRRDSKTVDLNLAPFNVDYPTSPNITEVTSFYKIDRSNSALPDIFSLPPEVINISGSAAMEISVKKGESESYLSGTEKFYGSLEIEVPLDLRINNIQFADTIDNFLNDDSDDSQVDISNFGLLRINLSANNGFPLGVSLKMSLYDSVTGKVKNTINAADILKAAPVDGTGKAVGSAETNTSIEFTKDFFKSVNSADKIIFVFTLNTTENGSKDVKIYSDYRIGFKASLVVKPDFNLN